MKIAIIGSGISGLTAAYLLNQDHDITLYEKEERLGGHAHTRDVVINGKEIAVDIGFIVFNHRNYPNLVGLFEKLNVETAPSDMSFGVKIDNGWLEYGTPELSKLFAQKRNLFRIQHLKMLKDILRFNKRALQYIDRDDLTLGQCLQELKMGEWFRQYFLLPMGGAIWSTPIEEMYKFPASTFIRFFHNHGLLTVNDQPQWHTVKGGSRHYVDAIAAAIEGRYKTSCAVHKVRRSEDHVSVEDKKGHIEQFDHVILACHSDQALALLENPRAQEKELLSNVAYQPNKLILHTDESFMPSRRSSWTSWAYLSDARIDQTNSMSLSYWMNNLQPLDTDQNIFVTLNPHRRPDEDKILHETVFEHPVFDASAIDAQKKIDTIQGIDKIHYCGAWQRYGFHEDGCLSAVKIAEALGSNIPWK